MICSFLGFFSLFTNFRTVYGNFQTNDIQKRERERERERDGTERKKQKKDTEELEYYNLISDLFAIIKLN